MGVLVCLFVCLKISLFAFTFFIKFGKFEDIFSHSLLLGHQPIPMCAKPYAFFHWSHAQLLHLWEVSQPIVDLIPPLEFCFQAPVKDEGLKRTFWGAFSSPVSSLSGLPVCTWGRPQGLQQPLLLLLFYPSICCTTCMPLLKTQLVGWEQVCSVAGGPWKSNP